MHKFKLKKDGEIVGYLRFEKYRPSFNNDLCPQSSYDNIEWYDNDLNAEYDSVYPFICLDKNGEEVYANDPIHYQGRDYPEGFSWNESSLAWDLHDGYFHTHYGAAGTGGEDDYFDIALIKE